MNSIPDSAFQTARFGPKGGGIDFLGMRRENLRMLTDYLIPGINNATSDFGTFCIAAWIPWKFARLANNEELFTQSRYRRFRETAEIAFAHSIRDDSPSNVEFGSPRLRIGVQQEVEFTKPLTFKAVGRTEATSLFAAPLYGPALRYLNLIAGQATAINLTSTGIPMAATDEMTTLLVEEVDAAIRLCPESSFFDSLDQPAVTGPVFDQLGLHGLNPTYYRTTRPEIKLAFLRKFLVPHSPGDQADYRRLTSRLICETVRQHEFTDLPQLRACWYSGLLPTGTELELLDDELVLHREKWALFQARQVQRTICESLLRCFEIGLKDGGQSTSEVVNYWRRASPQEFSLDKWASFEEFIRHEASPVASEGSFKEISLAWHAQVHGDHPLFEDLAEGELAGELWRTLRMLARWWIRMQRWLLDSQNPEFLQFGQRDRMSLKWFSDWVKQRLSKPLPSVLEDCFSELVFSQHIKVALARFDGQVQRLRFTLGDSGIIPTREAASKMGQSPVRMADRLASLTGLLTDLDVIEWKEGEPIKVGHHSDFLMSAGNGK